MSNNSKNSWQSPLLSQLRWRLSSASLSPIVLLIVLLGSSPASAKILALGDSLTFGHEVDASLTWPKLVEKDLGTTVVNGGTSGATTAFGMPTLKFHLKRYKPSMVIYALGGNDGLRGLKPAATEANIEAVIKLCHDNSVPLILLGMKAPPNYGKDYTEAFESIYPRLAKKYSLPFLPFMLEGVAGQAKYNQPDGIHPNKEGYQIISKNILNIVKQNYGKQADPKSGKGS